MVNFLLTAIELWYLQLAQLVLDRRVRPQGLLRNQGSLNEWRTKTPEADTLVQGNKNRPPSNTTTSEDTATK
jgi:hypothetical protein